MADAGDALDTLTPWLESDDAGQVAAAVWDVLDLGGRFADSLAWRSGIDSLQAIAAAQSCRQAIRYVPAPPSGRPVETPAPAPDALADCARLLERVAEILQAPAGSRIQPDPSARRVAAGHAAAAHQAFAALTAPGG
ncbi:hypothetical protein ACWEL8_28505 [Streptomyces sp. NPDC004690]